MRTNRISNMEFMNSVRAVIGLDPIPYSKPNSKVVSKVNALKKVKVAPKVFSLPSLHEVIVSHVCLALNKSGGNVTKAGE